MSVTCDWQATGRKIFNERMKGWDDIRLKSFRFFPRQLAEDKVHITDKLSVFVGDTNTDTITVLPAVQVD